MKVRELVALLSAEDQEAEVFSVTGQGCPMQYEVLTVMAKEHFAKRNRAGEYEVLLGHPRDPAASEVFLIEGPLVRLWRPLRP